VTRINVANTEQTFNTLDFSVQENGGNLDASRSDGGSPQITATILDYATSSRLMDDLITISDDKRGTMVGTVRGLSASNGVLTITGDSYLSLLNTYRSVPPMNSANFGAYINSLFSYLGITVSVSVQSAIASHVFPFPGFVGNVYDQLKALCAARNYEMTVDSGIRFRASRANVLDESNGSDSGYSLNSQQSAQQIVVNYKNYSTYGNFNAYPPIGSDPASISPITVNANEIVVQTFPIAGTAASVSQPVVVDSITLGSTNQYAVIGNDGLPITAAQWIADGGNLSVRVLPDDPSQIEVTVTGPRTTSLSPYRIAESSGNNYNALYIRAQGVASSPGSVTINTGAPANVTSEQIGVTVDNPYISTLADAYTNGMIVAANYAGPQYTVSGSSSTFKSPSNGGLILGFGTGNRLLRKDANFIVTSTSTGPSEVQYGAALDTLFDDFNAVWTGTTFDTFNTQWVGYTFTEMTPIPLRRTV
jgi:hypothetical protein